jgi:uncharacterized protein YkwD
MGFDSARLRRNFLPAALALLLAALPPGCALSPPPPDPALLGQAVPLANPDRALLANAIFRETNRVRVVLGDQPLRASSELDSAADEQALHMTLMLRTEHSNPLPGEHTAAQRVTRTGFKAALVEENAIMFPARPPAGSPQGAYSYSALAAAMVQAWLNSPGHRANLLNRRVTELGCAAWIARDARGEPMAFATQVFALPASAYVGQP